MQVKVCGVRDREGAEACARAKVDYVGLNFVPGARRSIRPREAVELRKHLGGCEVVGLFRDASEEEVEAVARETGLDWVQLHGAEGPEFCRRLRRRFRVIKAFEASVASDPARLRPYVGVVDIVLVDGARPGSGTPWEWSALVESRLALPRVPFFLAGGLDPWNVSEAISAARPDGVDAASGVEREGRQDAALIEAFVSNARGASVAGPPGVPFEEKRTQP